MYLLFQPIQRTLRFSTFTPDGVLLLQGQTDLAQWTKRNAKDRFATEVVQQLRSHGKVLTGVGIVLPYAPSDYTLPVSASAAGLKRIVTTPLRSTILATTELVLSGVQQHWPHLPQLFLFDTFLSERLTRRVALPPFDYDTQKTLHLHPVLHHSYGHTANMQKMAKNKVSLSLYMDESPSMALFEGTEIIDAIESYSPLPALAGLWTAGSFDGGMLLELLSNKRINGSDLLTHRSGLIPMTENIGNLQTVFEIAGVSPRQTADQLDSLSIETIEWIELSAKSFIRSLRHAIGRLMASGVSVDQVIINTSVIPQESALWPTLRSAVSENVKFVYCNTPLLSAAASDLMSAIKK